jgi:hypothetical protein
MAFALGACASGGGQPPAPAALAGDREQPVLALFEHVLTGYFAGAGAGGPTTCARLSPTPLTAEQETALIRRFVRLAPAERCVAAGQGTVDAITGEPAQAVQVYQFACQTPELCSGWVAVPGAPATRYAMRFEGGAWRFDSDRRIIAE